MSYLIPPTHYLCSETLGLNSWISAALTQAASARSEVVSWYRPNGIRIVRVCIAWRTIHEAMYHGVFAFQRLTSFISVGAERTATAARFFLARRRNWTCVKLMPIHSSAVTDYNPYTGHIHGLHHKAYSGIVRVESMVFTSMLPPFTGMLRTEWMAEQIISTLQYLPLH
jgi:hypothetical protein